MGRTLGGLLVAGVFVIGSAARADDVSSLKAELADLKAKVAAMESSEMAPAAGGDAESLTSMKKKGAIKIGGSVGIVTLVVDRDEDPTQVPNGEDDDVLSTEFYPEASLKFDVAASKDMGVYLKLDLEDFWDAGAAQDDLLEECYFYWKHVGGSNWQLNFGKKEVKAFGQDKAVGYIDGFMHGEATLFDADEMRDGTAGNAHADVGDKDWLGEVDNVLGIEAIYKYKDLAKFYLHLFQNNETTGGGRRTRGMHEDRSDDTLFFQSFAAGVHLSPIEGLHLELSFINVHVDSYGDEVIDPNGWGRHSEADTQALSAAFDYKFKSVPVEVFGEYVHQWDEDWDDRQDADVFSLGLVWGITENIDFGLMGEYMNLDTDNDNNSLAVGDYTDEDYWNVNVALTHKFESGIAVTLEYIHQWFDGDRVGAADDVDADADAIGLIMDWSF